MRTIESKMINVEYVSVWDGCYEIVTACQVDVVTGVCYPEMCTLEDAEEVEMLEREFIRLADGSEFEVFEDGDYVVEDLQAFHQAIGVKG